jgi:diguanylate cyclase (GGDEF)-like protein
MELHPLFLIPAIALCLAGALVLYHMGREQGYKAGVASAQIDPATRLMSAAMARKLLAIEFAAAERGRPLTIVLFNVDNFARLAALDGGAARDRLLLMIGAVLRKRTRGMHVSAPLGEGGTFISILGGSETRGAATFVARVRKDMSMIGIGSTPLVVSVSVVPYRPEMHTVEELLSEAHGSLAEARARGGNQIVVSGEA